MSQSIDFDVLQKYRYNSPDWDYVLNDFYSLGASAPLGDLDKDGNNDVLLGLPGDGTESGSGEILVAFLKSDGSVRQTVKIASGINGFNQSLTKGTIGVYQGAYFGISIVTVGDINDDGVQDIAVGAYADHSNMVNERCGSVYILMMNDDGTVKAHQRLGEGEGGFVGWGPQAHLGTGLAAVGDINNDSIPDLVIASDGDRELGPNGGAVFIVYLNRDGTVKSQKKITPKGSFFSDYSVGDRFGIRVSNTGDINGDGNFDILVGTVGLKSWLVFLDENQEVIGTKVYDYNDASIRSIFLDAEVFGHTVSSIPDINYDGRNEILLSAYRTTSGYGEVALIFLNDKGDITGHKLLNKDLNGLDLEEDEDFGSNLSYLGDLNNDGFPDIGVGGGQNSDIIEKGGAVYVISVVPGPCVENECLWPGDCNNDGVVNSKDLIPIGSAFLDTNLDARRILPTTDWMVQYARDWEDKKWQVDKKLGDCNGDGIINIQDRNAIYTNYGFNQEKMLEDPELDPNGPLLNLVAIQDSITVGDTAKFDLYFGEPTKEAENIYGISLSLRHEVPALNGKTKNTAKFPAGWFGEDGIDMITLSKEISDGIDISLVRTDKINKTGHGIIASIDIVIPDNLGEIINETLKLKLTDVLIVSYEEDTIIPDFKSEGIDFKELLNANSVNRYLHFYPNPTKTILNIQVTEKIESIKVVDIHGRELLKSFPNSANFSVNISHLSEGNYFLIAESVSNKYVTRISKK